MIQRTILIKYGTMTMVNGRVPKSRLQWRGAGIEFYVRGSLAKTAYETAANLAMNETISHHIPAISLRRVGK